jgi:hypothetical protein
MVFWIIALIEVGTEWGSIGLILLFDVQISHKFHLIVVLRSSHSHPVRGEKLRLTQRLRSPSRRLNSVRAGRQVHSSFVFQRG